MVEVRKRVGEGSERDRGKRRRESVCVCVCVEAYGGRCIRRRSRV